MKKTSKKLARPALSLTLALVLLLSGFPSEVLIQAIRDRNVVDVMWQAGQDGAVVDLFFHPEIAHATEIPIDDTASTADLVSNNASPQIVWISDTEGFAFYIDTDGNDSAGADVLMASTTDSGATWGNTTTIDSVNTTDAIRVSVWYDRWTPGDTTGNLIHIATLDTGADETYYTQYNTVTDALSTTVITIAESGTFAAGANSVTITKAEDGALYISAIDGADAYVHRCTSSCTSSANWSAITNPWGTNDGNDHILLLPVAGTDNAMVLWWDISTNDIESNIYSATSSSWWGFNTGINQAEAEETTYDSAMMGATVNRTTGEIYFAYIADNGTNYTVEDHDIDIWEFDNSTFAWTQKTASALVDMAGGLTGVKIAVDENTGDLYLAYLRRTTIGTIGTTNVYWRTSTDNGETWGAEQGPLNSAADDIRGLSINIMSDERISAQWKYVTTAVDQDGLYHETIVNLSAVVVAPTVTTNATAESVTSDSATVKGNITATGGANATVRGFAWGTNSALSGGDTATTTENGDFGVAEFSTGLTSLSASTQYFFRGYATNSAGTGYGNIESFTTSDVFSITITSSGVIEYGFVELSTASSTVNNGYAQTARNDSSTAAKFNVKSSDATGGTTWTLASSVGSNIFKHEFSTTTGSVWTVMPDSATYVTASSSVAVSGTVNFDFRLTTPSASADYQQKSITITVQAVAPGEEVTFEDHGVGSGGSGADLVINHPATVNEDDLLIAVGGLVSTTDFGTNPAGWNDLGTGVNNTTRGRFWYKLADGTEGGTTAAFPNASSQDKAGLIARFSGVNSADILDATGTVTADSASTYEASVTTVEDGVYVVLMMFIDGTSGVAEQDATFTGTGGITFLASHYVAGDLVVIGGGLFETAGAQTVGFSSDDAGNASRDAVLQAISLNPQS